MKLFIGNKAAKELSKISDPLASKIYKEIVKLKDNPYPVNYKKIVGEENYRIRIGVYRVIYSINKKSKEIFILKIRHRRDVYR
jgi:mRNA interferase RelE/StbE